MDSLVFPSLDALQIALKSGLVPPEVQRAEAKFTQLEDGSIEILPSVAVPAAKKQVLKDSGVIERTSSSGLMRVSCWAATVPAHRTDEPAQTPARVLFTVPTSDAMLELCGELLRLGCDRQEFRIVHGPSTPLGTRPAGAVSLVRVSQPPWFVLSRALDRLDGLRAWVPTPPGQDAVWTELGFVHPLVPTLELPSAGMLLVPGEGDWQLVADGEWTDVDQLVEPVRLPGLSPLSGEQQPPRLSVTLKLARAARHEPPSLWVVKKGLPSVEGLVRATPEAALEDLLFAISGETVILRTRPGRESGSPALPGDPYSRLFELPNLFAPLGLTIEPPLRRDRLRTWLAGDPDLLSWLEPTGAGAFARITIPETAFRPLSEWVDYVIAGGSQTLEPWMRSATFDFDSFTVAEDALPGPRRGDDDGDELPTGGRPRKPKSSDSKGSATARTTRADPAPSAPHPQLAQSQVPPSELEAALAVEEQSFLELEAPADSADRRAAWVRLAELYAQLNRQREAGLCWGHAIWEADNDEALELSRRWATVTQTRLDALLALSSPTSEQTLAFVAHLTQIALSRDAKWSRRTPQLLAWLDKFDENLGVRALWLGRVALSLLSGGDALLLARARDRVLVRLTRGLSLERDVPRLLRVTGQANTGGGSERTGRVAHQLESILRAFDDTSRKRSLLEAEVSLTRAYVGFEFAWGFARLGQADRSRSLREASLAALPKADPVHSFLTRAYSARIDQALEGLSPEAPLAAEITASLGALEPFLRFKIDRLCQASTVLEPQERLDPNGSFLRRSADPRGEELAALRGLRDTAELVRALEARAQVAGDNQLGPEERARLLDALLDFLPQLPESSALPLLNRFVTLAEPLPALHRVVVLEDALKVAGHFGRVGLVKQLVHSLGSLFTELGADGAVQVGPALAAGVHSLRRVGLRSEAAELLQRASGLLRGEDPRTLSARLALAAGFAYLGTMGSAQPIFNEALSRLSKEKDLMLVRLQLTRSAARALGHAPTEVALPGLLRLSAQLPWITDSYSTNSTDPNNKTATGFCLSLVEFADALVLGHVGDDLTLNEVTRRFLEEDEYLVRRRVHRDAGG